jgi:uncharacterized protein (TIGR04255 family)
MGKKYKNPPIVEALCEFQFVPTQLWDITVAGLLYEKIKDEFPLKQQQVGFRVAVQPGEGEVPEQKIEFTPPRMQFFNNDKNSLVQIGPDLLTVNYLKPYPTWEKFKPLILKILGKYIDIANPKGFRRIGLRYINKIDFDQHEIVLMNYFNYYPSIPNNLPQTLKTFQATVEIPYDNERDTLRLTLGTLIPEKPDTFSLMLDLDYIMVLPEGIALNEVSNWLEDAHTKIDNAFEACVKDECRKLFEEVK